MKETISFPVSEQKSLRELEAVIEDGLLNLLEVGYALLEIKDRKLHRFNYLNFDVYCQMRWKTSYVHACRHIEAAKIVRMLLPTGDTPRNESPIRLFAPSEPKKAMDIAIIFISQLHRIRGMILRKS